MHRISPPKHPTIEHKGEDAYLRRGLPQLPGTVRLLGLSVLLLSACVWLAAQSSPAPQSTPGGTANQSQKDQGIPDAPSTVQPPKPAPETPPTTTPPPEQPGQSSEPS